MVGRIWNAKVAPKLLSLTRVSPNKKIAPDLVNSNNSMNTLLTELKKEPTRLIFKTPIAKIKLD